MNIRNFIIIMLLMFAVSSVFGSNKVESETFYTVQLPVSGSYNYSFKMTPDTMLYFNINNPNSEISFDFVDSYHILANETNYTLKVDWNIDDTIFPSSKNLVSYLTVSNNRTPTSSYVIAYNFSIIKSTSPIVILNGSSKVETINGTFYKIITVEKLPEVSSIPLTIKGSPNQQFYITNCSQDFLICDDQQPYNYNSNGVANINLRYNVPMTTSIGKYNQSFNIKSYNRDDKQSIIFDIRIPDIFITPLTLSDDCYLDNQPLTVQVRCEREIQEYRLEIIKAYQEYISKVNTEKICSQFIEKEYIVGDSISELVLNKYNEVLDENKYLREDNDFKSKKILELETVAQNKETEYEKSIIRKDSEIQDVKEECHNEKVAINTVTKNYIEEKDITRRNWYKRVAMLLVIAPVGLYLFKKFAKSAWNFNLSIPDILLLILFIIGLLLTIVLVFAL